MNDDVTLDITTTANRDYRKELWISIATAVARAESAKDKTVPGAWADAALKMYDSTFREKK